VVDGRKVEMNVSTSDEQGKAWTELGSFTLKVDANETSGKTAEAKASELADSMAAGLLGQVVRAELSKGPKNKGMDTYKIRIDNASPLILSGLAVAGPESEEKIPFTALAGIGVAPHRSLTLPASPEMVDRLSLKQGVRVVAADLNGL